MPNSNLQAVKDPKVNAETEGLREGFRKTGAAGEREYAAYLRTQMADSSAAKFAAILVEMPEGYALQIPNAKQQTAVSSVAESLIERYSLTENGSEMERARTFATRAVARLNLAGRPASEVERAVQAIAEEHERIGAKPGAMNQALDRVIEARMIERQSPEMREQAMLGAAELLRRAKPGPDMEAVAVTHRLIVDSLEERALEESARTLKIDREAVVQRFNSIAKGHEQSAHAESFNNAVKARDYAARLTKTELVDAGIRPQTAEVIGSLANREWLSERRALVAEINEAREDVRRFVKVKPEGKFVSAEDAMLAKISDELRAGHHNIDLSTVYKTTSTSEANRRHETAFRNLSELIPDLGKHGYVAHKGAAAPIYAKAVDVSQQIRNAIGMA